LSNINNIKKNPGKAPFTPSFLRLLSSGGAGHISPNASG